MLHNFWSMASKFPNVRCHVTEFYADSDEKISFSKFWFFLVDCPKYTLSFFWLFFGKCVGEKYQNFIFLSQFLTLKNMMKKFFRNSNFSDFLGIKSEIHQYDSPNSFSQAFQKYIFWLPHSKKYFRSDYITRIFR